MWLVMVAGLMLTTRSLAPQELVWTGGGYTLLAALLIGAIAGGAPRRVFRRDSD